MSILSGLFDGGSSNSGSSDNLLGALDAALSIDASNTSYDQSTDSDGSSHTSYDQSSFGTSLDTSSLLHNMFSEVSHGDFGHL